MDTEKQFKLQQHFCPLWQAPMALPCSPEDVSPPVYRG